MKLNNPDLIVMGSSTKAIDEFYKKIIDGKEYQASFLADFGAPIKISFDPNLTERQLSDSFDAVSNAIKYRANVFEDSPFEQFLHRLKEDPRETSFDHNLINKEVLKEMTNTRYDYMFKMNDAKLVCVTIKKVIFNDPATIVIWTDHTKTVVKCGENDTYDPEKGLALCFMKKILGNTSGALNKILKREVNKYYMDRLECASSLAVGRFISYARHDGEILTTKENSKEGGNIDRENSGSSD